MLLLSKSLSRYLSLNSLFLCLEKTDPTRPPVFQVTHRKPSERKGPHPSQPVVRCNICGGARRASCLQRERVEAGKARSCCSPLGTSGESEDLEKSNLAKRSTGQTKDIGLTCKQVAVLIGNVSKQVRLIPFVDWASCTTNDFDWRTVIMVLAQQKGQLVA